MAGYKFSREPVAVSLINSNYRDIKTTIPAPGTKEILERLELCESRSMQGQLPIIWDKAVDFNVFDKKGNKWIDFTSSIFVANVGHSNQNVINSIKLALDCSLFSCYAYANEIRVKYLENLVKFSGPPFEKAFLLSAGTEATEAAIKLMRMHGQKIRKKRLGIVCVENNWHGRTMGAQFLSSNISQKSWIGYQDPDIHYIRFPYPWIVEGIKPEDFLIEEINKLKESGLDFSQDICGFMLETFQGWGALFYPKEFVQIIKDICRQNGILLTFDEMQAGFARTGKAFGYMHYGVEPDLICCGKGMGGGVPLSGVIGRAEIMDLPDVGNMSSTHSANPLVCSAGQAVLDEIIRLDLVNEARRKGVILEKELRRLKSDFPDKINYVFNKGLIAAILFKHAGSSEAASKLTSEIVERCYQKGLLVVHTGRESIKIGPPLTIPDAALVEGLDVLRESISETCEIF